eukprot:m51a1_g10345 putative sh2 domain-containing protein (663) ;mRNA; r:156273-159838
MAESACWAPALSSSSPRPLWLGYDVAVLLPPPNANAPAPAAARRLPPPSAVLGPAPFLSASPALPSAVPVPSAAAACPAGCGEAGPPEIDAWEIEYDEGRDLVGEGAFARVFRARVRGHLVAAKVPRQQHSAVPVPSAAAACPAGCGEAGPPEIDAGEIEYDEGRDLVGEGAFARVYRARVRGHLVAAKVPRQQHSDEVVEVVQALFEHEVAAMRKVAAPPHVAAFLGACTQKGKLAIITQYMPGGDLARAMHDQSRWAATSPIKKLRMALDVAMGMNWLHGICNLVHRNLKPENLLLDAQDRLRVSDLSLSWRIASPPASDPTASPHLATAARALPVYTAPELLLPPEGGPGPSAAVDVYSFGVILWEMVTCRRPYEQCATAEQLVDAVARRHARPDVSELHEGLAELLTTCWYALPENRPPFARVVRALERLIVELSLDADADAAAFWEAHFASPLQEQVPWRRFREALRAHTGVDELCAGETLDQMLAESVPAHVAARIRPQLEPKPDWYGLAGLLCDTSTRELQVTTTTLMRFCHWFGGFTREAVLAANELAAQMWFHGCIDQKVAIDRLRARAEGVFLVRTSLTQPDAPFTLSVNQQHMRIVATRSPGGLARAYSLTVRTRRGEKLTVVRGSLMDLIRQLRSVGFLGDPCPRIPFPY